MDSGATGDEGRTDGDERARPDKGQPPDHVLQYDRLNKRGESLAEYMGEKGCARTHRDEGPAELVDGAAGVDHHAGDHAEVEAHAEGRQHAVVVDEGDARGDLHAWIMNE